MTTHVLLVEDNLADVELVREVLLDLGDDYRLHAVEHGLDALRFLRREAPFGAVPPADLVLLDLNTPLLGGLDLLGALRAGERPVPEARLVVFSASHNPDDERRALELGAQAYLLKPTGWDEFSLTVREILRCWAAPPAAPAAWE